MDSSMKLKLKNGKLRVGFIDSFLSSAENLLKGYFEKKEWRKNIHNILYPKLLPQPETKSAVNFEKVIISELPFFVGVSVSIFVVIGLLFRVCILNFICIILLVS